MTHDFGAYELFLPDSFDIKSFEKNAIDRSKGQFWLICTEDQGDFKRFAGVFVHPNSDEWISVWIDMDISNRVAYTPIRNIEFVKEIAAELNAVKIYKDGVEIT